jgi:hypothetical protein
VILLVPGLFDSYQVQANGAFVAAVPDSQRGQAYGLALGGMQVGQGAAMLALAPLRSPPALGWPPPQQVAAGALAAALISFSARATGGLARSIRYYA